MKGKDSLLHQMGKATSQASGLVIPKDSIFTPPVYAVVRKE